ncbi:MULTISPECIES: TetR/AcrR family transcriptional regulator [Rhizobium]|uniref:HTH tetR-type domain-containing protein n=1 Tax=Rhizobium favelukesii TaxID=348824 RepID=W6RUG6_9HYPH|nr:MULTISPECIES: TetR/AcrR family transcriptional regulator [Rhizobium]MCS0457836.1 TetR/AcrR family transcriptional regulator [Rhizobium favelukesii]UFS80482.1 TetR/AcrR family transcriptional regulator [Rhizobium sp. T136]CDM62328.1 hypothetical protein LPU83_pLPU83d_0958 [Rhizobium favelukesii]
MEVGTIVRHPPRAEYASRIIEAGTEACRLYGPSKTNVADIARLLGKSPASVYKIFPSKATIWNAVAENFFQTDVRFPAVSTDSLNAADRLQEHVLGQHHSMLKACHGDRQMFNLVVLAAELDVGTLPSVSLHRRPAVHRPCRLEAHHISRREGDGSRELSSLVGLHQGL